jgi:CBS domain-containing protein
MTLREVLHAHIPSLTAASTLRDAIDKMDIYQFPALVLVDGDMKPIGVLTEGDVCRAVAQQGALVQLSSEPASKFCTLNPKCVHPDMEISDALHLMLSNGLTILPIEEGNRLLGIVLRVDLMQALLMDAASA